MTGEDEWPDGFHRAQMLLYGMFDYFDERLKNGEFSISGLVTDFELTEDPDSLAGAPVQVICDIGYKFRNDIKLCGKSAFISA